MKSISYYNGVTGPAETMTVPLLDRALFFGDGCYEAAFIMNGHALDLEDHLRRFSNSMRLMRITPPWTVEELRSILTGLIDSCLEAPGETGMIYWQCSRGTAPRSHCFPPAEVRPNLLATVNPKAAPDVWTPAAMITGPDTRYFHCNIKTLNLFPNVMANQNAKEAGAVEQLFIRPDNTVTEGSHTNLFILRDGVLRTHETDERILPGITRLHILEVAQQLGIPVVEKAFSPDELRAADEIFISGSSTFLKRCHLLDGQPAGMKDESAYRALAQAYLDRADRVTQ